MGCQFLGPGHAADHAGALFVVCPVPYDATASYGAGARNGPARIIEASVQLELFDEEIEDEPWRSGIHTLESGQELPVDPEMIRQSCFQKAREIFLQKKVPVFLGGDHSISIGVIQAAAKSFDNVTMLQLDAHTDMRDQYQGTRLSHACTARRAMEVCSVVQAGIRSCSKQEWDMLDRAERLPVTAASIRKDLEGSTEDILARIDCTEVYVTIDVDCLDPSIMPATGTPEPGGLDWFELTYILRRVAERHRVIGFDVVELAPIPGLHHAEYTCARLVYKMIGYIWKSGRERR